MKSFFKGFAAAIFGTALFLSGIVGWSKLNTAEATDDAMTDSANESVYDALIADRLATLDLATDTSASTSSSASSVSGTDASSSSGSSTAQTSSSSTGSGSSSSGATSSSASSSSPTGAQQSSGTSSSTATTSASSTAGTSASGVLPTSNGKFNGAVDASKAPADYAAYMQKIESELKPTYGSSLRVEYLNKQILISVWEKGLVDRLTNGQSNGTYQTIWNSMKVALSDISTTYTDGLHNANLEGARVHAHLLNENDLDKIILAYSDGKLMHDGLDHE